VSLCVQVAYAAQMKECDEEGYAAHTKEYAALQKHIRGKGVLGYTEPLDGPYWWAQLVPSNGVAYLQRCAWRLWNDEPLPPPCAVDDDVLDEMAEDLVLQLGGTNEKGQSFEHLCFHPVDRGFWVPVDFESVVLVDKRYGGCLGSSVRLLKELEALAAALKLNLTTDHNDKAVWAARDNPGGRAKWQKYGIESFNCLRMYRACQKSLELGAAVRFS
jgi:hypothetical protein